MKYQSKSSVPTIATICSGGGLVEIGAILAGYKSIWAVDNDRAINEIHRENFPDTPIYEWDLKSTEACKWDELPTPDLLHISPPCQNFSVANRKRGEISGDIAIAISICRAIRTLLPKAITIENVKGYAASNCNSWGLISAQLIQSGYYFTQGQFNASDWGVAQDRVRFLAIATRNVLPPGLLAPIGKKPTILDAIGDLIPKLPLSQGLTGTQINGMPKNVLNKIQNGGSCLIQRVGIQKETKIKAATEQSFTILASIATDGKGSNRQEFMNFAYNGTIYSLTPRAIARLMGCPDWYKVEGWKNKTIVRALGNGVCPPLYEAIALALLPTIVGNKSFTYERLVGDEFCPVYKLRSILNS